MTFATPVLLTAFRRPDMTARVLSAIARNRPARLFISFDGARSDNAEELRLVEATRALVDDLVTWPCDLQIQSSDTNLGCRLGMTTALDWFFSQVEEGIVLEDDCLPHPDFFPYCAELLERFRDEPHVMCISGDNSIHLRTPGFRKPSYSFVRQPLVWGWATWRSAWEHYDRDLVRWAQVRLSGDRVRDLFADPIERAIQVQTLDKLLLQGRPDTWDFQWGFTLSEARGLCVVPRTNLIQNIGFSADATHTRSAADPRANVPGVGILPLRHPRSVRESRRNSRTITDHIHGGAELRRQRRFHRRAAQSLRFRFGALRDRWTNRNLSSVG